MAAILEKVKRLSNATFSYYLWQQILRRVYSITIVFVQTQVSHGSVCLKEVLGVVQ